LTVTNGTQWADGVQGATVVVSVFDNCNQPISGLTVQLSSSRGALDIITPLFQTGNQSTFVVSSINLGTSTLSAVIDPAGLNLTMTQTGTATFVCVSGSGSPLAFFPQDVQYGFGNPQNPPAPFAHTLRALTVTWDDQGGTRKLMTVKMGATVIWSSGSGVTSPFTINVTDWTSISRTINPGASRSLVLSYNVSAAGGTYTLNPVTWDDGAGSNICASAPVSASR